MVLSDKVSFDEIKKKAGFSEKAVIFYGVNVLGVDVQNIEN